jgi:hypothetical protein
MLTFPRKSALIAAALLSAVACTTSNGETTGEGVSDHTVGQPVTLNNRYVWAEISDAEFGKGLSSPSGGAIDPVRRNDPTTVRVQQWLDRYHGIIGEVLAARGEVLVAPKPSAALVKEYGPNAWVSTAMACPAGWTLRPTSSFGGSGRNLLLTPDYAYGVDVSSQCVSPQNWTDKSAFASFFNTQSTGCQLSLAGDQLTVSGSACTLYGSTAPLATYAVSSTIGVTLDAITWGEELRLADTLAHELGHYYRAHSNPIVQKEIGFFYRDEPNGPDRPVPTAESAGYEDVVNQLRGLAAPIRVKPKTHYNKRLAAALYSLRGLCPNATIAENTMRALMSGQVTTSNTSAYLAFENVMASCAPGVSITDPTVRDQLETTLRNARISLYVAQSAATLDEALADLTNRLDELDRQEAGLVAKMATGMFGWYTDEQEADEIGLELATRAGLSPSDIIAANVRTYEQLDALYRQAGVDRGDEVTMATCKQWLAAGFTEKGPDGATRPVHVPIGSLSDTHHDGCYRIYNLWREAKRHQYVVAAPLPALSPSWETIQAQASTLGGTKPPATSGDKTGAPDPSGDNDGSTTDPEETAPPPRRPKPPASNAAAPGEASDAGVTTVTKTTSSCALAAGSSRNPSAFGASAAFAIALILRRRRWRASTSSRRRA